MDKHVKTLNAGLGMLIKEANTEDDYEELVGCMMESTPEQYLELLRMIFDKLPEIARKRMRVMEIWRIFYEHDTDEERDEALERRCKELEEELKK